MSVKQDEIDRLERRIAKSTRRIKLGYDTPKARAERKADEREELESVRKVRLEARLEEIRGRQ